MVDLLRIYYGEGERGLIYVEKKTYQNKDLAPVIAVNPDSSHLKRDITNQLIQMGYEEQEDFKFPKRGYTAIMWVPQSPEEKIPYLCRLLDIDSQVDSFNFATFVYCLLEEEDFQCRPWEEKQIWLRESYGVNVTDRTLRSWVSKLMKEDTLIKDKNTYTWWSTTSINGQKIREELDDQDQDIEKYKEFNREFFNRDEVKKMDKNSRNKAWFSEMWKQFGRKFYKCYAFTFGAWNGEVLTELITVTKQWLEERENGE